MQLIGMLNFLVNEELLFVLSLLAPVSSTVQLGLFM